MRTTIPRVFGGTLILGTSATTATVSVTGRDGKQAANGRDGQQIQANGRDGGTIMKGR